jgi:predicted permease
MMLLRRIAIALRDLLRPGALDREMDAEMRFHLDMQASQHVAAGVPPDEARRRAQLEFGGLERFREAGRDARGARPIADLQRDLRFALRSARRAPGYTAVIVLTLALGIGATTSIFSVVREVLLRDLPFTDPERLVRVWVADPSRDAADGPLSLPDLADWRAHNTTLTDLAGYSTLPTGLTLVGDGEPVRLGTAYVSPSFFSTLGVRITVGRAIRPDEHVPGNARVVVLSHRLWQSRFGGDRAVIGRSLRLNDAPYSVVGVMPSDVRFPGSDIDLWAPLEVVVESSVPRVRGVRWIAAVGRLRPGVTIDRAREDLSAVAARLADEFGESNGGWRAATVVPMREHIIGEARTRLLVLFGAVTLVLILACANIANLALARGARRQREMAVRAALGADRGRLVRQLLVEAMVLALFGGVLGIGLAVIGTDALAAMAREWLPGTGNVRPDGLVIAFALGISLLCGIAFGIIPAAQHLRDLEPALRRSGRGTLGDGANVVRRILVASQVALAVILVLGASLLGKSFARLSRVDLGFDAEQVAFAKITIPTSRYADATAYLPAAARMLAQLRAIPGAASVAAIKDAPLLGVGEPMEFTIPERIPPQPGLTPQAQFLPVSTGYFRTMGIPLLSGSDLGSTMGERPEFEIVLSETAAKRYWPDADPIGEEIAINDVRARIVGVAADARYASLNEPVEPVVYSPYGLMARRIITFVARAERGHDPATLLAAMRQAIRSVEPEQPITRIGIMPDVIHEVVAAPRFLTMMVGAFGLLALVIAAIGVYGVVAFSVGQRVNEIGVRMALGARPHDVASLMLRSGLMPVALGLGIGAVVALVMSRTIRSQLYDVSTRDPAIFAGVLVALGVVSLIAVSVPALRAARLSPTEALRNE